jgi:hypothetical protein
MNEEEVNKAIEARRLPLDTIEKMFLIFYIGIVVYIIKLFFDIYLKWGAGSMLGATFLCLPLLAFMGWRWLWSNKKLIPYLSTLTYDEKTDIIEKLLTQPGLTPISKSWVTKAVKFYGFNYKKGSLSNYSIKLLYNESGYFVNSIIGFGQSGNFSSDTANEIIDKIKKLEAELK